MHITDMKFKFGQPKFCIPYTVYNHRLNNTKQTQTAQILNFKALQMSNKTNTLVVARTMK